MELFGYSDGVRSETPLALSEVSLVATPAELRQIAQFLEACASAIEAEGDAWSHEHAGDKSADLGDAPQFVVVNPGALG